MIETILNLLYSTNKKTFKGNSDYQVYPYISGYSRIACGKVWKNKIPRLQYKPWKMGPDKYKVCINDKGYEYEITAKYIKVIKYVYDTSSVFPLDVVIFKGENLSKEDHFNLALQVPMLSIEDFQRIRNFMQRKDTRYVAIYMYLTKEWI